VRFYRVRCFTCLSDYEQRTEPDASPVVTPDRCGQCGDRDVAVSALHVHDGPDPCWCGDSSWIPVPEQDPVQRLFDEWYDEYRDHLDDGERDSGELRDMLEDAFRAGRTSR
jgi:hypothetical protein